MWTGIPLDQLLFLASHQKRCTYGNGGCTALSGNASKAFSLLLFASLTKRSRSFSAGTTFRWVNIASNSCCRKGHALVAFPQALRLKTIIELVLHPNSYTHRPIIHTPTIHLPFTFPSSPPRLPPLSPSPPLPLPYKCNKDPLTRHTPPNRSTKSRHSASKLPPTYLAVVGKHLAKLL